MIDVFKVITFNQWWSMWRLTLGVRNLATHRSVSVLWIRQWRVWPLWQQLNFYCQDREVNDKTTYWMAEIIKRVSKWTQRFLCKRLLGRNRTVPKCVSLLVKYVNKNPTRCNSMQIFIYCKATLHVSGVTAPIIRSTKNCNRGFRYRS